MIPLLLLFMAAAQGPVQPLPYSHKQHIEAGLKCKDCHDMPDPGEVAGIPPVSRCMACHQSVKKDSPAIQRLTELAKEHRPVPWIRVYQIPSYVAFSHKAHVDAGASCETCHGEISQMDRVFKAKEMNMGSCMACHQQKRASLDCAYCHEPR